MAKQKFDFELVVVEPFGGFEKGEIITDTDKIAELVGGEYEHHFVKKAKAPADPA